MNWKKFFTWLAQVGGALAVVTVLISAIIYVVHAETSDLRHDIATLKDDVQGLRKDVGDTNHRIDSVLSDALDKLVSGSKSGGPKGANFTLENGEQILSIAKRVNAKLDPKVLAAFGKRASALTLNSSVASVAWRNFTQTVNYRSFLNSDFVPKTNDLTIWPKNNDYRESVRHRIDESAPTPASSYVVRYSGGYALEPKSARLETLDNPQKHGSGIGLFVIDGGADFLVLDRMYMKNVIVRNARVIYEGGPVRLENVSFVNCTFILSQSQPVLKFGDAILEAASISFSTTSPG